ncbi:MAG: hypothetical protein ABI333_12440 [bacterium]
MAMTLGCNGTDPGHDPDAGPEAGLEASVQDVEVLPDVRDARVGDARPDSEWCGANPFPGVDPNAQELTSDEPAVMSPLFSWDGSRIAYSRSAPGPAVPGMDYEIYLFEMDTWQETQITFLPDSFQYSFHADGTRTDITAGHSNPPDPNQEYPTVWVTRAQVDEQGHPDGCAGEDCSPEDYREHTERRRCEVQTAVQSALSPLSRELDLPGDFYLGTLGRSSYDENEPRATILTDDPDRLAWRFNSDVGIVDQVLDGLARNPDAAEYGVVVKCYRQDGDCDELGLADTDGDGWCDQDDCCPGRFNWTNDHPQCVNSDSDSLADVCDNCPTDDNEGQLDFDLDGVGNVCDPDIDGDGVLNEADPQKFNRLRKMDTDGDMQLEPESEEVTPGACDEECRYLADAVENAGMTPPGGYYLLCYQACESPLFDNCADDPETPESAYCENVRNAVTSGDSPDPTDIAGCRDLFYNPGQEDESPQNGIGDRCDLTVRDIVFEPANGLYPYGTGIVWCTPDEYRVEFRANASTVGAAQSPAGTSIETCSCDPLLVPSFCGTGPNYGCNALTRYLWQPIRATEFHDLVAFPYGGTDFLEGLFIWQNEMARNRIVTFDRRNSVNRYSFLWEHLLTKAWPDPFDVYSTEDAQLGGFQQRLRISWSDAVVPQDHVILEGRRRLSDQTHIFAAHSGCQIDPVVLQHWQMRPWWFDAGVYLESIGYTDPPREPFAIIRQDGSTVDNVVLFDRSPAKPRSLLELPSTLPSGRRPDLDEMRATSGVLAARTSGLSEDVAVIVGFEEGSGISEDPTAGNPTVWLGLVSGASHTWTTAGDLLGGAAGAAPNLEDAHVVFDSDRQMLYLLGNERPGETRLPRRNVLHVLDLENLTWTSIGRVDGLGEINGYSVSHDPLKRRLLVFGGGASPERGTVTAVDLASGLSYRVAQGDATLGAARRDHGAFFDLASRTLYAAGGITAGVARGGVIALDVDTGVWSRVAADDPAGPAARIQPVLHADATRGKLWLAGGIGVENAPELKPWELDLRTGAWIARPSLTAVPSVEPGVTEHTLSEDSRPRFFVDIDPAAPLPGELRLITVQSTEPNLQLVIQSEAGAVISTDDRVSTEHRLALLGEPGRLYAARVLPGPGYPAGATVPITVRNRPAALSPVYEVGLPGNVSGVVGVGGTLYVARNAEILAYDLDDPASPLLISSLSTGAGIDDVIRCGPHLLCTAHGGGDGGLKVIDVSDPASMTVVGALALAGPCRSVTARDTAVYLACGPMGVAQVSIIEPKQPFLFDVLDVGDVDVVVRARRGLLVVASGNGGRIKVYRSFGVGVSELIGEVSTDKRPRKTYLGAQLIQVAEGGAATWLKCLSGGGCPSGQAAEAFAVDEIGGVVDLVGSYSMSAGRVVFGEVIGDLVVHRTQQGFRIHRVEELP